MRHSPACVELLLFLFEALSRIVLYQDRSIADRRRIPAVQHSLFAMKIFQILGCSG
jgi:hypothetical protein